MSRRKISSNRLQGLSRAGDVAGPRETKKTAKSAATVKNEQETLADDRTVEKVDIDVAISPKTKTKRTRRRRSRRPVNRENVNDKSTDGDISEVVKSEG